MKTLQQSAGAFLTVLVILPLPAAFGHTINIQASWMVATARHGQLSFLKRDEQPKEDPFAGMSASRNPAPVNGRKGEAIDFIRRGREALTQGNLPGASYFRDRAAAMNVQFGPDEDSPARLDVDIRRQAAQTAAAQTAAAVPYRIPDATAELARVLPAVDTLGPASANQEKGDYRESGAYPETGPRYAALESQNSSAAPRPWVPETGQAAAPAGASSQIGFIGQPPRQASQLGFIDEQVQPAGGDDMVRPGVQPAYYSPEADTSHNELASASLPRIMTTQLRLAPPPSQAAPAEPRIVYEPPVQMPNYRLAANPNPIETPAVLPPSPPPHAAAAAAAAAVPSVLANPDPDGNVGGPQLITETTEAQQRLKTQIAAEVARQSRQAVDMREKDPMAAIGMLQKTRAMVAESKLPGDDKQLMLTRVDRMLGDMDKYVEQHRAEIELDQQNRAVKKGVEHAREYKLEIQQRLATLVDEYNKLRNDERFYEAEAKAKEARQLAPDEPVVVQMWEEIKFFRRVANNRKLESDKETGFWEQMNQVEKAAIGFDDSNPIVWGDKNEWEALSARRKKFAGDGDRVRHPAELEIEKKLNTPVSLKFKDAPLSEIIQHMKDVTGINIFLDPQGLAEEGVHPSSPVSIDLSQEISLRSALSLILTPLNLNFVIKNEVLKITSEQLRDRTVYPKTYNVADLVIPIPDFVPHDQLGLPNALARGYDRTYSNLASTTGFQPPVISVAQQAGAGIATPDTTLAQQSSGFANPGRPGGTAQADFDALIELITKTIEPDSWDEVGGPGSVAEFETNLSLVISQTQEVHEKIADLLEQLRRLQDLQVTIEVRFITLQDDFFEQIGIDFDFNIDDNVNTLRNDDRGRSNALGLQFANGMPTDQLAQPGPLTILDAAGNQLPIGANDIQIRQGSFPIMPAFGGFDPATATTFGVAILSDIEAYFLVRAAQGDSRTNVMQSPKVTLFNGQAASISDQIQQPFVTSVTPVVGDFAAAQAPVIVVLAEGTTLSVQAVVSPDRRFVRLTLVPFFSEIRDVDEFTFTGSTTSTNSRSDATTGNGTDTNSSSNAAANTSFTEGTTIQLPTFAFTTVTTTVSVPDGGTVLLGGIKRLRENREELGTPFLSKLPYISRLFKNVGVGREAQSLMLMVTPRIIIQEEEEEKLGLALP